MAKEKPIIQQIKDRKRKWIGHTLRKDPQAIEGQVLYWSPQERRKSARPKRTRRRTVEEETGEEAGALAQNRIHWRFFLEALCS
jgi:hypothetical protein